MYRLRGSFLASALIDLIAHLLLASALCLAQIIAAATRVMSADNTWHFRFAKDIVQGVPIFWASVDANRLFPDAVFGVLAATLPFGTNFEIWLKYFYILYFASLYASVCFLATVLGQDRPARLRSMFMFSLVVILVPILLPYWGGWIFDPGNHGTAAPVCIALVAAAIFLSEGQRIRILLLAFVVAGTALVVASNRFLIIAFIAPLATALIAIFLYDVFRRGKLEIKTLAPAITIIVSAWLGYLMWIELAEVSWIRLVAPGFSLPLPTLDFLPWLKERVAKEYFELFEKPYSLWDIQAGFALLACGVCYLVVTAARSTGSACDAGSKYLAIAIFAVLSALLSYAFVFAMVMDPGRWHFRYSAMSFLFVLIAVCLTAARSPGVKFSLKAFSAAAVAAIAVFVVTVSARELPERLKENKFMLSVQELNNITDKSTPAPPYRGLAEYWLALDMSARTDQVKMDSMEELDLRFRFYNNNASDVCADSYSFVLYNANSDRPRRSSIIATLGEPIRTREIMVPRHGRAIVMFYDPQLILERVIKPARARAKEMFPSFSCPK